MDAFGVFGFIFGLIAFSIAGFTASQIAGLRVLAQTAMSQVSALQNELEKLKAVLPREEGPAN